MKNTKLYPFERNKYYYGKLLSVEDFNAEQKYMNDKRRLVNRLLHGAGVVSGLGVVQLDEQTITVDSGMALDPTGREVVVDAPVTKKLSLINGYDSALGLSGEAYVYLCLEYSESEKEESHNIAAESGKISYDKIREGYTLYLSAEEPDDGLLNSGDLFEQTVTVFRDGNMRIRHIMPRCIHPDGKCELKVEIEVFTKKYAAFSYDIQLICLNSVSDAGSILRVSFDEMLVEKTGKYTLTYDLCASDVVDTDGTATVDSSTFTLSYDKVPARGEIAGKSTAAITSRDIADVITENAYRAGMDSVLRSTLGQRLYLARINLVNAGGTVVIEDVQNVPFGQYIPSRTLLRSMDKLTAQAAAPAPRESGRAHDAHPAAHSFEVASGVCRINLNAGSYKNKVFFSEEIVHGLGLGSVTVTLGIPGQDGSVVYGAANIFAESVPLFETAVKLSPNKGSFVIGVMTKATIMQDYIDIKWTAIRDVDEAAVEKRSMRLTIKPSSLVLAPRESRYLEAVCTNMTNKTVRWTVSSENGGEIDQNGMYVAPNTEGVYEVVAQSAAYPEIKASIMVVVRN